MESSSFVQLNSASTDLSVDHRPSALTAGLDLALALVEEDLGRETASQLVMFFKRPGGQMQFTGKGEVVPAGRAALQEFQRWVAANPELDHSVASLAKRMELSPRHFARLFRTEAGVTRASWVEEARRRGHALT